MRSRRSAPTIPTSGAISQSFEMFEALIRDHPLDSELRREAALVLMDLGEMAAHTGRLQEGLDRRAEAVERLRALSGAEPQREDMRFTLGWALGELAASLEEHGRPAEALQQLDAAQSLLRGLSGADAARLNTTQFLIAVHDMKSGRIRLSLAEAAGASRERREAQRREARTLLRRSAQVLGAAQTDAVLGDEAKDHLRTVHSALRDLDASLPGRRPDA